MRFRFLGISALLAAAPFALEAANPHIIVNSDPPDPVVVMSDTFGFGANALGGGILSFQNASGQNWRQLNIQVTLGEFTSVDCGAGPFGTCVTAVTAIPGTSNFAYDIMFGPTATGGITNGELFSINLNNEPNGNPNSPGGWGANTDFNAVANLNVPEPSNALLIALGGTLLTLFGRRALTAKFFL